VFVGSEPNRLAISDDGQFLYVGLDGAGAVRQVTLSTMTPDLQFSLGSDPFFGPRFADDIAALPGSPTVIAVARRFSSTSPRHAGVAIYENGAPRTNETARHTGSNLIEFGSISGRLYGYNNETTEFGFRKMTVDASGVVVLDVTENLISQFSGDIKFAGDLIYSTSGRVIDAEARTLVGTFIFDRGFPVTSVAPDVGLNRTFYLEGPEIVVFDTQTFRVRGRFQPSGVSGDLSGLIRWSANGLAFRTTGGQVYVIQGSIENSDLTELAVSNPPPTATAGTGFNVSDTTRNGGSGNAGVSTTRYYLSLDANWDYTDARIGMRILPGLATGESDSGSAPVTIPSFVAGGAYFLIACADDAHFVAETNESNNCTTSAAQVVITPSGPPDGATFTRLTLPANDLIYDRNTQRIYASVPSTAGPVGNTITAINPLDGTVAASVFVGSEPNRLAMSDDGQFLYVGLDGAGAVRRLLLPTLPPGLQIPLGNESFFGRRFAEDIAVLPGSPQSYAMSRRFSGFSARHAGVAIYDGATRRSVETPRTEISNAIEFGSLPARLYGYNQETTEFGFRRMSVDSSGVTIQDATPNLIQQFSADIKFAGGLIYSTPGRVIDPEPRVLVGTFAVGSSARSVAPDVELGRVFFLRDQDIQVFDRLTFQFLGAIPITGGSGLGSLTRWGADGLAFRTSGPIGVILVQGPGEPADLVMTNISDVPSSAGAGTSFSVTDTVANSGAGGSAASTTGYYLSLDAVRDSGDTRLAASRNVPALSSGASSTGNAVITIPEFMPGGSFFVLSCADDLQVVSEANEANNCAASAARVTVISAGPFDPLVMDQWHLHSQRLEPAGSNALPAWAAADGSGVVVGIVDDGLQHVHPDLQPGYMPALSFDFNNGDSDPSPIVGGNCNSSNCHGTAVAGVAAARGGNGIGGSGAAPLASLAGLRLIAAPISDAQIAHALSHEQQAIHILNNSWGPSGGGSAVVGPGPLAEAAIQSAAVQGRGGRGRIFVWAAGNGAQNFDNCNFDGFATSRFAIAVGALTDNAQQAFYSEPCAAMLVTAPSSGGSRGITTADLVGTDGYSFPNASDYTNTFGGTSSAAPLVSGVVALMLDVNPNLTWRDVQHILVRTGHKVQPGDAGWSASRYPHNEKFGFGLVDAEAAVALASRWRTVLPETAILPATRALNVPLPDNNATGRVDSITIGANFADFRIEHVEIEFNATHTWRGDLEVTLISPSGVVSRLATKRPADSNDNFVGWRFRSVRHWGEPAAGTWTLRVADAAALDVGTWQNWTLRIYGTQPVAPMGTRPAADFDGDGRADLAVYRPSTGGWILQNEAEKRWGAPSDIPVPGDYDGDRLTDIAVFRPSEGRWYIEGQPAPVAWGRPGDIPVAADYDGDGRTDIAVIRQHQSEPFGVEWLVRNVFWTRWGATGDIPVPGDYNGDGAAEVAVYRPSNGRWFIQGSSTDIQFGAPADVPVPAGYDGDGRLDVAVFRPSTGVWFVRNQFAVAWGTAGDLPVALDVNGDSRAELVIFRRSQNMWFSLDPFTGVVEATQLGGAGDVPASAPLALFATRRGDFDGDRTADPTVYRPSNGIWYSRLSSTGFSTAASQQWGMPEDLPVPGDYLGTGWNQPAGYRPSDGTWRVAGGPVLLVGASGDVPVPADYDGDGRMDIAVWTPSSGVWRVRMSSTNWLTTTVSTWGASGDIPVPGDYDGDRRSDLAVFRPSDGRWYILQSSTLTTFSMLWGAASDVPVVGDYEGDGRTDVAVWRPATGQWFVKLSSLNAYSVLSWGASADIPVPADYDGDGRTNLAVYEPSGTWRVMNQLTVAWGTTGDIPVLRKP
jgi:subtilisin-like proprotein convertase family protein